MKKCGGGWLRSTPMASETVFELAKFVGEQAFDLLFFGFPVPIPVTATALHRLGACQWHARQAEPVKDALEIFVQSLEAADEIDRDAVVHGVDRPVVEMPRSRSIGEIVSLDAVQELAEGHRRVAGLAGAPEIVRHGAVERIPDKAEFEVIPPRLRKRGANAVGMRMFGRVAEARPVFQPLRSVERSDAPGPIDNSRGPPDESRDKTGAGDRVNQVEAGASVRRHALVECLRPGAQVDIVGPQVRGKARGDRTAGGLAAVHEYEPVAVADDQGRGGGACRP